MKNPSQNYIVSFKNLCKINSEKSPEGLKLSQECDIWYLRLRQQKGDN
jgi:hypothetical protein